MWALIALLIFAVIVIGLYYLNLLLPVVLFIGAGVLALLFYKFFVRRFEPYEASLIYRFGRLQRVTPGGWTIVIPGIERIGAVVDLREQMEQMEIPIISQEGLKLNFLAIAYFYVSDAVKAILDVRDYRNSLMELITSRVRDLAGEFSFTQLVINVEDIAETLRKDISNSLENWGVELTTFEIEKMEPPDEVMDALRGKRVAEEKLEAKKFMAEARRVITAALGEGTRTFDDKTITYLYVKALENMKSAKMMVPAEFMDIVKPGGKSSLAKGMIAGTTFNKALNMVGQEIMNEASIGKRDIEDIAEHTKHSHEQDEQAVAGDSADGHIDGSVGDNNS